MDPHHFQQWDRYHAALLQARIKSALPYGWGLTHIRIDLDRLTNGELSLLNCGGILPDGTPFEISGALGNAPETRNLTNYAAFTPSTLTLNVYLAIPSIRQDGANVRLPDSRLQSPTRFHAYTASVSDENTGETERAIDVARMNFQIRLEGESMQGYTALQIAQITRTSEGGFALSPKYVPSCLQISASTYLNAFISRIVQNLVTHSSEVSHRAARIFSQRETTPEDVLVFGRLGVVNANIPLLKHYQQTGTSHPEALYLALVSLAGQLFSYISNARTLPQDYPSYNHAQPTTCFNRLDEILAELIKDEVPVPDDAFVDLALVRENIYQADIEMTLLQEARFFIVVISRTMQEHQLIAEFPSSVRVASPGSIDMVVQSAIPALTINHTSRLPASVPVDDKASYFELHKGGHFWDAMVDDGAISIFVPYNRGDVDIKLLAVKRS